MMENVDGLGFEISTTDFGTSEHGGGSILTDRSTGISNPSLLKSVYTNYNSWNMWRNNTYLFRIKNIYINSE